MARRILLLIFLATLLGQSACTSPCDVPRSAIAISASTTCVKVGEVVTVTVTLSNQGCIPLHNVSGSLDISYSLIPLSIPGDFPLVSEGERLLSQRPLPMLGTGASVSYQYVYRAVKPGCVIFTGHGEYFVLDAEDWYGEIVESTPLTITVLPEKPNNTARR